MPQQIGYVEAGVFGVLCRAEYENRDESTMLRAWRRRRIVHFLHIGKTGGSAIKEALENQSETSRYLLKLHGHGVSLSDIPKGELAVFFLRDPISRFISGFYSRKRKGQPRYFFEWNDLEKAVFECFSTPNELASALSDRNSKNYSLAVEGMENIRHFKRYDMWYEDFDYFLARRKDILFVGFQESLDADFERLKTVLKVQPGIVLPSDDISAHRSPDDVDRAISDKGGVALKDWYTSDYKFIALCRNLMEGKNKKRFEFFKDR